jgi:hypothetical protein
VELGDFTEDNNFNCLCSSNTTSHTPPQQAHSVVLRLQDLDIDIFRYAWGWLKLPFRQLSQEQEGAVAVYDFEVTVQKPGLGLANCVRVGIFEAPGKSKVRPRSLLLCWLLS